MKILKEKRERFFQIFSFLLLFIVFIGLVFFINTRIDFLLSSDDSSEMVLGKLLSTENSILSKNWYYSTELRVLNTQLFYALFFKITNNWHTVRVLSYISMYLVILFQIHISALFLREHITFPILP